MRNFGLEVHPAPNAPAQAERLWVERRGETALVWRLSPKVGGWRVLADIKE
jgi:hypothetical protein